MRMGAGRWRGQKEKIVEKFTMGHGKVSNIHNECKHYVS